MAYHIIIVEDHVLLRQTLADALKKFLKCDKISGAGNGRELLRLLEKGDDPDLVILDIAMPEMDGYETAAWLQKHRPAVKILVLTGHDSGILLRQMLQYGVRGFLLKNVHKTEFERAIQTVLTEGYYYASHSKGQLVGTENAPKGANGSPTFSEADLVLLRWLTKDLSYKEIAAELKVSVRTIESRKDALCQKFDIQSRVGLAMFAIKNGIAGMLIWVLDLPGAFGW